MSDPPRKRQRTARACTKCRQGKLKCDGALPACSTCVTARKVCSYEASQKRRGLRGGYVRAMEALLGIVLEQVEGGEDVLIGMLEERFDATDGHAWAITVVEDLAEFWRQSKLAKKMERLVPKTSEGESEADVESEYHGNKPKLRSHAKYRLVPLHSTSNVDGTRAVGMDLPAVTATIPSIEWLLSTSQESTTLPTHSVALVDSYFISIHSWFPIVERHHIYRTYYQHATGRAAAEPGHLSCLMAILASAEVRRATKTGSQDNETLSSASKLLRGALGVIPLKTQAFELAHVQALLISSLAYLDLERATDAWILVSRAAEILLDVNSNAFEGQERLPHVIGGCQILDCIIATRLRLRPHSWNQDPVSLTRVSEDGMEEWASSDGIFLSQAIPTGPMMTLSTFNDLADATVDLTKSSPEVSRPGESSNGMARNLRASVDVDIRPREDTEVSTPQRLTLDLLRLASTVFRRQHDTEQNHLCARIREFCQSWTANLGNYQPEAVPQIVEPLWGVVVESVNDLQSSETASVLQSIIAALSTSGSSPELQALRARVDQSLALRQREDPNASLLPLTPDTSTSPHSDALSLAAANVSLPKRIPIVAGLGIQDVDFSLVPELEDESGISDQPLNQIMLQLRDTAVMPTASHTPTDDVRSSLADGSVGETSSGEGYIDQLSWEECDDSLQNLGFPVLDGRAATIHPLLNLPMLTQ